MKSFLDFDNVQNLFQVWATNRCVHKI